VKKNLIVYASRTGNTEKVANELAKNFERYGWESILKKLPKNYDAKNPDFSFDDYDFVCVGSPVISELPEEQIRTVTYGSPEPQKLNPGPKCGIVFCTYGGIHLGPPEATPALKLMEVELMHQCYNVIGSLAIPGGRRDRGDRDLSDIYFTDLNDRPNAQDMKDVAAFVDEIMTKLKDYHYYQ
jgi:flavorubredoxin